MRVLVASWLWAKRDRPDFSTLWFDGNDCTNFSGHLNNISTTSQKNFQKYFKEHESQPGGIRTHGTRFVPSVLALCHEGAMVCQLNYWSAFCSPSSRLLMESQQKSHRISTLTTLVDSDSSRVVIWSPLKYSRASEAFPLKPVTWELPSSSTQRTSILVTMKGSSQHLLDKAIKNVLCALTLIFVLFNHELISGQASQNSWSVFKSNKVLSNRTMEYMHSTTVVKGSKILFWYSHKQAIRWSLD